MGKNLAFKTAKTILYQLLIYFILGCQIQNECIFTKEKTYCSEGNQEESVNHHILFVHFIQYPYIVGIVVAYVTLL